MNDWMVDHGLATLARAEETYLAATQLEESDPEGAESDSGSDNEDCASSDGDDDNDGLDDGTDCDCGGGGTEDPPPPPEDPCTDCTPPPE